MDKYQEFAFKRVYYAVYKSEEFTDNNRTDKPGSGNMSSLGETNNFVIKQDEDYRITKHYLRIAGTTVQKAIFNGKEYCQQKLESSSYPAIIIPVDFSNQVKEIEIHFKGVLDPVKVPLNYIESDKAAFDRKMEETQRKDLIDKSGIKIATGADLVNIYFNPASDDYESAKIELYTAVGRFEQHHGSVIHEGWKPQLLGGTVERLIAKYKVDEGMFFKSITGLAKGVYGIKIIQLDSSGKTIVESDIEFFAIR